ncbi:MAG TPA: hypothetical protein VD833_00005 [Vicinamibacterales bacterium]|nr:hypothetical protein [Vicinamibacterales bacterium]
MAAQTGSTGSRQGKSGESRTPGRSDTGITQEQQNTAPLDSPASRAAAAARIKPGSTRESGQAEAARDDRHSGNGGNGGGLAGFVRQAASNRLTQQKERATRGLGDVARAVRQTTDQLRAEGQETVAGYIERAADGIDRFSHTLESRDVQDVVDDIQSFARRQPVLFMGAAFGLGLAVARFLKSSSRPSQPRGTDIRYSRGERTDWRSVTAPGATASPNLERPIGGMGQ